MMVTIGELAKLTGLSSYEIRRRVKTGSCPHIRVGAKNSKVLIEYELFVNLMREENLKNMTVPENIIIPDYSETGHGNIRVIN